MLRALESYPATLALVGLNLIIFFLTALQADPFSSQTLANDGAVFGLLIAAKGEWWRLISGMFLHGGVTHILLNMISLYIVGKIAEELFGWRDYLIIYFVSGIAGGIASVTVHPDGLSVGASGAIFGIFGAIAGYALAHRKHLGERFNAFIKEFGGVLVLNLVLGFSIPGIDMSAHIGGLVVGAIAGYIASRSVWLWTYSILLLVLGMVYIVFFYPNIFAAEGMVY